MDELPKEMNDQLFQKLKSAIELQRMSAKERLAYEMSIAAERDLSACMAASYEEGKERGKAEGVEEGIEKGIEKGKAEGLLAGMRQVASNMKRKGMDLTSIMDCTGLSADVILTL